MLRAPTAMRRANPARATREERNLHPTHKSPRKPACRFCDRHVPVACRSTRDMDPVDGLNHDVTCNATLERLDGGERGFVQQSR